MKHSHFLTAALFTAMALPVGAQDPTPPSGARPQLSPARVHPLSVSNDKGNPAQDPDLKHFNLDFPGGPPSELAAAISKATGKTLNLIIPTESANVQIMPIKVTGVTVPDLFSAIRTASRREVPIVTGRTSSGVPGMAQRSIQFKIVGFEFTTSTQLVTDESVWSFTSTGPTKEDEAVLGSGDDAQQVCKYFQLGPYLLDHKVEDITTAIQTGWKMMKADPMPQLSFHEETKLLIAVGPPSYVEQIPKVLEELMLDNTSGISQVAQLHQQLAEIQAKQEGDWEKKAQGLRDQIEGIFNKRLQKERPR